MSSSNYFYIKKGEVYGEGENGFSYNVWKSINNDYEYKNDNKDDDESVFGLIPSHLMLQQIFPKRSRISLSIDNYAKALKIDYILI